MEQGIIIPEPKLSKLLFADTRFAWIWLVLRLYVGWEWLTAGWEKVQNPAWFGGQAGSALQGFRMERSRKRQVRTRTYRAGTPRF